MTERRVVVTGIGINPLGNNVEEYFSNLEKGVSGAAPITHFNAEKFKTKFACEVKNYDPSQYFDRKEVDTLELPNHCVIMNIHRDRKDISPTGQTILPGDQLTIELDAQDIEKLYEPLVSMANIY